MSQAERVGPPQLAKDSAHEFDEAMQSELDRRISELAAYSETAFGPLGIGDLMATLLLFVLLPLLLVWVLR
jgi:hypothetical protein